MDWLIKSRKILVAGDSWAESAWDPIDPSHQGLATFFREKGYQVDNIGTGGLSNMYTLDRIEMFLNSADVVPTDSLVFLTCPLRDLKPNCSWIKDIHQWADQNFDIALNRLTTLSSKFQINFYVIGGLADLPIYFNKDFSPRVKIAVHSFSQMLDQSYSTSRYGSAHPVKHIPKKQQALEVLAELETKLDFFRNNSHLYPDTAHPGIAGHKTLFDYLIKNYF